MFIHVLAGFGLRAVRRMLPEEPLSRRRKPRNFEREVRFRLLELPPCCDFMVWKMRVLLLLLRLMDEGVGCVGLMSWHSR